MSQEDVLRLAAEIVDKYSGPLRDMTKAVHSFQDMLKGTHTEGSKLAKEQTKQQLELHDSFEKTARTLSGFMTPSMAALGLSVGGASGAIGLLIGNLKEAGDRFYALQGAMARTGMGQSELEAYATTISRISKISVDTAREQMAQLGDTAAKLSRNFSPEFQRLESTFSGLETLNKKMAGEGGAEAARDFWKFYTETNATPDQKRKLLEAYHIDPNVANATAAQFREELKEQFESFGAHPPPALKTMSELNTAFDHLHDRLGEMDRDFTNAFGGTGAKWVERLANSIGAITKDVVDLKKWLGGEAGPGNNWTTGTDPLTGKDVPAGLNPKLKEFFSGSGKPPWTAKGLPPLDGGYQRESFTTGGDAETTFSQGVYSGTFKALQEWYSGLQASSKAVGGGGGIIRASLGGSGASGGPRFGNADFPNLSGGGTRGDSGGSPPGGGPQPAPGGADNTAGGGGSGLGGSAYLESERARYAREFAVNPALKERLAAIVDLENPKAGTAVTESLMNRMNLSHRTIESGMAGGPHSFYGPARHPGMVEARMRELQRDPKRMAARMAQIDAALGGSNLAKGYTDQGSRGDPNYDSGGIGVNINGERFNDWGVAGSRAYRERQQAMVSRDLLDNAAQSRLLSGGKVADGAAHIELAFKNAPAGVQAYMKYNGLFKSGKVDWGHAMPSSDPGG